MDCRALDCTLPTLAENLALDEALLLHAEAGNGPEVLRFWEWPALAVVLGVSGRWTEEVYAERCTSDAVPIQRRSSGGGTVLLGPGCLLYSLILAYDRDPVLRDIHGSYRHILGRIARALEPVGQVHSAGVSDLAIGDRKVSGSSQQRKRDYLLHHGTLLYSFDVSRMEHYLRFPPKQPAYRDDRPHSTFVTNLNATDAPLKGLLAKEFEAAPGNLALPMDRVEQLVAEKYGQEDWVRRR